MSAYVAATMNAAVPRVTYAILLTAGLAASAASTDRPFGIALSDLTPEIRRELDLPEGQAGAFVASVVEGGRAARAGIRAGDVVLEVNRKPVRDAVEATAELGAVAAKEVTFVLVWRDGDDLFITIVGRK